MHSASIQDPTTPHDTRQVRKQRVLTHGTPSVTSTIADAVVLKDGDLFLVTEPDGHMPRGGDHGFGQYYGTVDATPLFLIVLARYVAWTGDLALFDELRDNVRRALEWIDRYGDGDGDGYVEYRSASEHGLINQGWKDSGDAIVDEGPASTAPSGSSPPAAMPWRSRRRSSRSGSSPPTRATRSGAASANPTRRAAWPTP